MSWLRSDESAHNASSLLHVLSCLQAAQQTVKKYRSLSIKKQSSSAGGSLETTQLGRLYVNNSIRMYVHILLYIQIVEIAILCASVPSIAPFSLPLSPSVLSLSLSLSVFLSAAEKPQRKGRGCMECAGCKREDWDLYKLRGHGEIRWTRSEKAKVCT